MFVAVVGQTYHSSLTIPPVIQRATSPRRFRVRTPLFTPVINALLFSPPVNRFDSPL